MKRAAVMLALLVALAGEAQAQRRDPPTFETDYTPPPTFARPEPRPWSQALEYVDFAVLAAALAAGAFFTLKLRSRVGIAAVMVFSLLYFGFYRMGCLCPIGSIQNVAEALGGEIRIELDDEKIDAALAAADFEPGRRPEGLSEDEFRDRLREAVRRAAREEFRKRLSQFDVKSIEDVEPRITVLAEKSDRARDELEAAAARLDFDPLNIKATDGRLHVVMPRNGRSEAYLRDVSANGLFRYEVVERTDDRFRLVLRRNSWNRPVMDEVARAELPTAAAGARPIRVADVCTVRTGIGVLPWLVVGIFVLPLIFAVFFGRVFCGSVCPLGAVQDVVLIRPLRIPIWLERPLRMLAVGYLAFAVLLAVTGSIYLICAYDPFVSLFRILPVGKWLRSGGQWAGFEAEAGEFFGNITGRWGLLVLPISFLVISMFVGRPYCRFLCPYGLLLRPLSRLSWKHASITPDECVQCRLCEDACPFNAIDKPAPAHRPTGWDKKRLAIVAALAPLLLAFGAWGGRRLGEPLARAHLKVRLKDRLEVEQYVRRAEAEAEAPPAEIAGRVVRVEKQRDSLLAVCEDQDGREVWRRALLEAEADDVMPPLDEKLIRVAAARDGDETQAVFIVRWVRLAPLSGPEELKSIFYLNLADGETTRREDLPVNYDPSEAFGRRRYVVGGLEASEPAAEGAAKGPKEQKLEADVAAVRRTFRWGGLAVGVFLAAAIAWGLLSSSVTRSRVDYEANKASCVSCGRCFAYCPREQLRRKPKKQGAEE